LIDPTVNVWIAQHFVHPVEELVPPDEWKAARRNVALKTARR